MKRSGKHSLKHRSRNLPQASETNRRGSVMVVIMILVVLLSLAAYKYTQAMITEYTAASMYGRRLQVQSFAESGVEMAADSIGNRTFELEENLYHDESVFSQVSMQTGDTPRRNGMLSIVSPNERDPEMRSVRFGFASESGKFNINRLLELEDSMSEVDEFGESTGVVGPEFYEMLANIPGLDDEVVVDCIMDWIDEDDDPRPNGAEQSSYPNYECRNGPIESLDELLLINGVTPEIVFGEDRNRNGLLDTNEDDGEVSEPLDDEDGVLNLGLAGYCTVRSSETNLRGDGSDRINLNQGLMTELFDAVEEEFDEQTAQFVVAFRLWGSNDAAVDEDGSSLTATQEEIVEAGAKAIAGDVEGTVTRAGMDLTKTAEFEYTALFDLVDAEVEAEINGVPTVLTSPWTSSNLSSETLHQLFDTFSLTDDALIPNRVDPTYARKGVLMTIPGIDEGTAEAIVETNLVVDGSVTDGVLQNRTTPGWLFTEGIVDLPTMRSIEPFLTARGDIFKVQIIGYFEEGGPFARVEALLDATNYPAEILSVTDLTGLGRGYSKTQLGLTTEDGTR